MSIQPGCQFASDNTSGMCPEALDAILESNHGSAPPYGDDPWTCRASDLMRDLFEVDCDVFFTFNGTAANSLALASLCQSYHSVIAHELAHVETDECGGPEFFSNGTKLLLVPGQNGCLDPDQVTRLVKRRSDVHFPKAKVLSITQSTEVGTVYTPNLLDRLQETVRRLDLNLHMDGARFSNAVASLEIAPKEMTWKRGVDVLCLGGTKNGMAVGECVVFFRKELSNEFEYRCKQAGQLASKMRYLAAPWVGLLQDGAWLRNAKHANRMATKLSKGLAELGLELVAPVQSNAVFVDFPPSVAGGMRARGWIFYDFIGVGTSRLMCSWATTEEEVTQFLADVGALVDSVEQSVSS